jgi:hypothetical protein
MGEWERTWWNLEEPELQHQAAHEFDAAVAEEQAAQRAAENETKTPPAAEAAVSDAKNLAMEAAENTPDAQAAMRETRAGASWVDQP